ncbi:hypothetical protein [Pseudomonas sp. H1_F01]
MSFEEDVKTIKDALGSAQQINTQTLLHSATSPRGANGNNL